MPKLVNITCCFSNFELNRASRFPNGIHPVNHLMKPKLLFWISLIGITVFEFYKVYLISPFPGSQQGDAVSVAWFLYHYRWFFRIVLLAGIIVGIKPVFTRRKWIPITVMIVSGIVVYTTNFEMSADKMFSEPEHLAFASPTSCGIPLDAIVIGVTNNGESKAYPMRYLIFHHNVTDVVGGKKVMVTYCSACRSGLVLEPIVDGNTESFRLVGMEQFNAMYEDNSTGSWWRQASGEAVAGELIGTQLPLVNFEQLTLKEWSQRHPTGVVMLPDQKFVDQYSNDAFEKGINQGSIVRKDSLAWQKRSWVVGIESNGNYRAYDWNELVRKRAIHDTIGTSYIEVYVDDQNINFGAKSSQVDFYGTDGDSIPPAEYRSESEIPARQMYWHTWKTFYPSTTRYGVK